MFRHLAIALLIFLIISALVLSAGYLFWYTNGKTVVVHQVEGLAKGKATIGEFKIIPPFNNLLIKDINIKGVGKIESVYISTGIIGFLTANIVLDEIKIIKPDFIYEKFALKEAKADSGQTVLPKPEAKKRYPLRMIAKRISVQNAKVTFKDYSVSEDGVTLTVKDIDINIRNIYIFPRSIVSKFEMKGSVPWKDGSLQGKIRFDGWVDFYKKNMQASLVIRDINGIYFYPYYSQYINLEKARIEQAKLDFTSEIQGLKNNLTADCRLELKETVFKPRPSAEPLDKEERLAAVVMDIFKDINKGKIALDFTIRTKMDSPVLGFGNIKTVVEGKVSEHVEKKTPKIRNIITLPTDAIKGTVKGLTDASTDTIRGTVRVLREIKNALLSPFRKEEVEPEPQGE